MKIGLYNYGTKGDIAPFIALAIELKNRGHEISLLYVTPYETDFSEYKKEFGINIYCAVPKKYYRENNIDLTSLWKEISPEAKAYFDGINKFAYSEMEKLCQKVDLVISASGTFGLHGWAEKYNVPYVTVTLQATFIPSSTARAKHVNPKRTIEESWKDVEEYFNKDMQEPVNLFRQSIGLEPLECVYRSTSYSYELAMVSISKLFCQEMQKGWEPRFKVVGYLTPPPLKREKQIPKKLENFITKGEAPIFLSLGSGGYFEENPEGIFNSVIYAAKKLNKRLIIQYHSSKINVDNLDKYDELFLFPETIDHRMIFPKCSVIIHHGGTGTTHAVCKSGHPSIVLHYQGDMVDWAQELKKMGISTDTIHAREVTKEWILEKLSEIFKNPKMFEKAKEIKELFDKEDPVNTAVDLINKKYILN